MKLIIDNKIAKKLSDEETINQIFEDRDTVVFRWPSLFTYLKINPLKDFSEFDETSPIFQTCLSSLHVCEEKEHLQHIYDTLFIEIISQIKSLAGMNASYFLHKIDECKNKKKMITDALSPFKMAFLNDTSKTMHDLILYLSFDKMCLCLSKFFDYQTTNKTFISALKILKECIIESYQHITSDGKCFLSFYRLIESLFFYELREENLQKHREEYWKILNQSFSIIEPEVEFPDFFYIDDALKPIQAPSQLSSVCYLVTEPLTKVQTRLKFANQMLNQLKIEIPSFQYILKEVEIIYNL